MATVLAGWRPPYATSLENRRLTLRPIFVTVQSRQTPGRPFTLERSGKG